MLPPRPLDPFEKLVGGQKAVELLLGDEVVLAPLLFLGAPFSRRRGHRELELRDALEFAAAGAANVALGTILFSDPAAPGRIRAELSAEVEALGVDGLDNVIGLAHAERPRFFNPGAPISAVSVQ